MDVVSGTREHMPCEYCDTPVAVPDDWPVDWATCRACSDWRPEHEENGQDQ